ncbi:hypothetical protein EK904_015199 [Melospiza melodia maxima]|nr:hypothetical protein EK904_015199 [Melospiza melodia maxima]
MGFATSFTLRNSTPELGRILNHRENAAAKFLALCIFHWLPFKCLAVPLKCCFVLLMPLRTLHHPVQAITYTSGWAMAATTGFPLPHSGFAARALHTGMSPKSESIPGASPGENEDVGIFLRNKGNSKEIDHGAAGGAPRLPLQGLIVSPWQDPSPWPAPHISLVSASLHTVTYTAHPSPSPPAPCSHIKDVQNQRVLQTGISQWSSPILPMQLLPQSIHSPGSLPSFLRVLFFTTGI